MFIPFFETMSEDGLKSIPLGQLMEMRKNGMEIRGLKQHDGIFAFSGLDYF